MRMKPKGRRKSSLKPPKVVDLKEHAHAAVAGARYHLDVIEHIANSRTWSSIQSINRLHWHLRAFFWELVAAMETAEQAITIECPHCLDTLQRGYHSEWYKELDDWRNFAHRAFIFIQAESKDDGSLITMALPPSGKGKPQYHIPARLNDYYQFVLNLIREVLPLHPNVNTEIKK